MRRHPLDRLYNRWYVFSSMATYGKWTPGQPCMWLISRTNLLSYTLPFLACNTGPPCSVTSFPAVIIQRSDLPTRYNIVWQSGWPHFLLDILVPVDLTSHWQYGSRNAGGGAIWWLVLLRTERCILRWNGLFSCSLLVFWTQEHTIDSPKGPRSTRSDVLSNPWAPSPSGLSLLRCSIFCA